MKDDMVLMLSKDAVERLLGDDPELEVRLKQAVLNGIARSCCRQVAKEEVSEFLKNTKNYDDEIRRAFEQIIRLAYDHRLGDYVIKMDEEVRRKLAEQVKQMFERELRAIILEQAGVLEETVKRKLQESIAWHTAYIEKEYSAKMTDERLDLLIEKAVLKKLAGK